MKNKKEPELRVTFNIRTPAAELPPDAACRAVLGKSVRQIAEEIIQREAKKCG